jgi:hypothetical protein
VSLGRVAGMFQSSSSIPALTRNVPIQDAATCTATLEVPVEARQSPDERRTSDIGAIASAPPPRSRRHWLVFGAVSLLLAAAFLVRGPLGVTPRSSDAAVVARPAAAPAAEAVMAPTPAAQHAPAASSERLPAAPVEPAPLTATEPMKAASRSAVDAVRAVPGVAERRTARPERVVNAPPVTELARANVGTALPPPVPATSADKPTVGAVPDGSAAPADSTVAPGPSPAPSLGRSAEIERLIQERR